MGRFIFMHVSSRCLLPRLEHWDPSVQSDQDDIEDAMDTELLSLSKPWSGEGEGNLGDWDCWSLHLILYPWPWEGCWGVCPSSEPWFANESPGGEVLEVLNPKWWLGQQIYLGMPRSSGFYLIIWNGLGYSSFYLPVMSYGWWWGRPIFLPMSLHL